ncbi:PAN-3 domain-containing protein [Caenorhabditis elegans]|uniref:PAN-3 domain-containing protein n=1 Tax=Caenorhabditis elegans TaxID=6239 RepID=O62155_CAEEL|nr:PAN-3 domain-containing protein [Caenorhabditis elegans]CAB04098.2 PAN-3 domain-containing protein [Caenorhabditis elegans]|eukprot:NP_507660.2 Uncharacterized protein CELE_F11D11.6 [Caenorhabditis elegans]
MWSWSLGSLFPYLILELQLPKANCQYRTVLIYGGVASQGANDLTAFKTVGECKNGCFVKNDCFLALFVIDKCIFFSYTAAGTTITVTPRSKIPYVAFKVDSSNIPNNTCPATYNSIKFSLTSSAGKKYSWTKTATDWKITT